MSLLVVQICQKIGLVNGLNDLLNPVLVIMGINSQLILPTLTKYLAGSTALVGILQQMHDSNLLNPAILTLTSTGFLLHPLDLPGVAIFLSAGVKIRKVIMPAILGGVVGIIIRMMLGMAF